MSKVCDGFKDLGNGGWLCEYCGITTYEPEYHSENCVVKLKETVEKLKDDLFRIRLHDLEPLQNLCVEQQKEIKYLEEKISANRLEGEAPKNIFESVVETNPKCGVCGNSFSAMYGCGWDYDTLVCTNPDCRAEIVFETTTAVEMTEKNPVEDDLCCKCGKSLRDERGTTSYYYYDGVPFCILCWNLMNSEYQGGNYE